MLSKRSRHLSLLVGALAVVSLLQAASAAALEPSSNAKARGCRTGGVHDINRVQPEWTSVRRGDAAQVAEGVVRSSNVAYHDFPFSHVSHDWNWDLLPDPAYQFLNGTDNGRVGSSRQMEIEWEEAFFPSAFRPAVGDRAWMLGRWVFDCGHSPYLTEIHPAKAVAHTRFAPTILPGDAAPSLTNKTFIWIHGRGGYYNRSVLCLPLHLLPGWLFGIMPSRVKPALASKLHRYRKECFRVLWQAHQEGSSGSPARHL